VRYGSIGGLEYEVHQSQLYCLCINVALCSTALQCICRVKRRSSMTMKAHTYYIIFGRPPIGGSFPLPRWRRHWPKVTRIMYQNCYQTVYRYYYVKVSLLVWHTRYTDTFCNAVDCRFELALEVQRWTRAHSECLPGGGAKINYATGKWEG